MADRRKETGDRVLAGETLSFSYQRSVSQQVIRRIWEQVLQEFVDHTSVRAVEMPQIEAYVLAREPFMRAQRQLLKSAAIRNDGTVEYGANDRKPGKSPDVSACFFQDKSAWIIIKRENFGPSLEQDLAYGLAHICRQVLILPAGFVINEHQNGMASGKPSKSDDTDMATESVPSGPSLPRETLEPSEGMVKFRKGDKAKVRLDCSSLFRGRVGIILNEIEQDSRGHRYKVKFNSQGFEAINSFAEADLEPVATR